MNLPIGGLRLQALPNQFTARLIHHTGQDPFPAQDQAIAFELYRTHLIRVRYPHHPLF